MSAEPVRYITREEYLALEREAEFKSEYYDGQMFAMAGASEDHVTITDNLLVALHPQARTRGCRIYSSELRVKISETGLYTYPDLSLVCGEPPMLEREGLDTLLNPTLLIEVLSPSTETYDRGRKFLHYQTLPSLREYVLVTQHEPRIERFSREPDGTWNYSLIEDLDAVARMPLSGFELRLRDVYADTPAGADGP